MYQLPKQTISSIPVRIPVTPGSKHKDRLKIQESLKRRQSNRKSFHRKTTQVFFEGQPRRKRNPKNHRPSHELQEIDLELSQKVQVLSNEIQKGDQYIKSLVEKIQRTMWGVQNIKRTKQRAREAYFQQNKILREIKQQYNQSCQLMYLSKSIKDDTHFWTKKRIFKLASQQLQVSTEISKLGVEMEKKNETLNRKMDKFQQLTESVATQQMKSADLKLQLQKSQLLFAKATHNYQIQQSQLFVLKFQINSYLFCGFVVRGNGVDRKLLLDKNYVAWDRAKQRKITQGDLKRFVLIQLYRGWKNLMRKLSYQSSQYQIMFGQLESEPIVQDLKRLLSEQPGQTQKKSLPAHISIHSQGKTETLPYLNFLKTCLSGFNNGLIKIIKMEQNNATQGILQLSIFYSYLGRQQLVEKFTWEECNNMNKDKIGKDLKGSTDRRIYCLVEVPIILHREDLGRYEEIFQIVKKRKAVGIRSASR